MTNFQNKDIVENSCYWSRWGHGRRECPSCVGLPACPRCGNTKNDIQKIVAPVVVGNPSKWVRCNHCNHQTSLHHTFKDALATFYG